MHDLWDPVMAECYLNTINTAAHEKHGGRRAKAPGAVRETVMSHTLIDVRSEILAVDLEPTQPIDV